MDAPFLTRAYLETLSSADLIALADDYDIDVPAELNRRFIIGELLDVAEELKQSDDKDMTISSEVVESDLNSLPDTYNESNLTVILRNPVWAFVYWDLSNDDINLVKKSNPNSFQLHVSFFEDMSESKASDSFDIKISLSDREQYVLIPAGKKIMRVDLIYASSNNHFDVIASSDKIELIHVCKALAECKPGRFGKFSRIMELSGMTDLLRIHYSQHKQSFTE